MNGNPWGLFVLAWHALNLDWETPPVEIYAQKAFQAHAGI